MKKIREARILLVVVLLTLLCGCSKEKPLTLQEQFDLGSKYLLAQNYEQAIAAFQAVLGIDAKYIPAYTGLVQAYMESNDVANGEKFLNEGSKVLLDELGKSGILSEKMKELLNLISKYTGMWTKDEMWTDLLFEIADTIEKTDSAGREWLYELLVELADKRAEENPEHAVEILEELNKRFEDKGDEIDNKIEEIPASEENTENTEDLDGVKMPEEKNGENSGNETSGAENEAGEGNLIPDKGAPGDVLTERMKLLLLGTYGFVGTDMGDGYINQEHQMFIVCMEPEAKGADVEYDLMNYSGETLFQSVESSIWLTSTGICRIAYFQPGGEVEITERGYIYGVVMEGAEGEAYAESYDWNGYLLERKKLEKESNQWWLEARRLYPPVDSPIKNVDATWDLLADGYTVKDGNGQEIGKIALENPEAAQLRIVGDLLTVTEDYCLTRVYLIQ